MEMTINLKKRFCKDNNLPIKIFIEPYFTSRLELFEDQLGSLTSYDSLKKTINEYSSEQEYFEGYNKIKEEMIESIKKTEGYKKFITQDFNCYAVKNKDITSKDVFKSHNIGKTLLSIDMVKANFNALKHYDKDIFSGAETYEEFASRFTRSENFVKSKYIRQVVLGNCNPKRQTTYQKYLMGKVLNNLLEILNKEDFISYSNDELIIDVTNFDKEKLNEVYENIKEKNEIPLKTELYKLTKIENTEVYVKNFLKGTHEFMCASNFIYPFIIRAYKGERVQEEDKVFYYEGLLAKFIDVPEIEISGEGYRGKA